MLNKESIFSIYRALRQPRRFLLETTREQLPGQALVGVLVLLFGSALLIFLAAVANADEIQQVGERFLMLNGVAREDLPFALQPAPPFYLLLFPLYWCVLIGIASIARYASLALLNPAQASFQLVVIWSAFGAVPLILVGALVGIYNQLFPVLPEAPASGSRVFLILGIVLCAWLLEARMWKQGGPELFALNRAQSLFVWIVPLLAVTLAILLIFVVLMVFAAGAGAGTIL